MSPNGSGIDYPKVTLAGVAHEVKFTRGALLYRLSKTGTDLAQLGTALNRNRLTFAQVIDLFAAAVGWEPTDAADAIMSENKLAEVTTAVIEALGKAFPPTTPAPAAADSAAPPVQ